MEVVLSFLVEVLPFVEGVLSFLVVVAFPCLAFLVVEVLSCLAFLEVVLPFLEVVLAFLVVAFLEEGLPFLVVVLAFPSAAFLAFPAFPLVAFLAFLAFLPFLAFPLAFLEEALPLVVLAFLPFLAFPLVAFLGVGLALPWDMPLALTVLKVLFLVALILEEVLQFHGSVLPFPAVLKKSVEQPFLFLLEFLVQVQSELLPSSDFHRWVVLPQKEIQRILHGLKQVPRAFPLPSPLLFPFLLA